VTIKRAVFLDRDGVINRSDVVDGKPFAPRLLENFDFLPGVLDAVRAIQQHGFSVIVITNQPDIANGLVEKAVVEKMNETVVECLGVDALYMCEHRREDECPCRKPKPGMLEAAARDFGLDLQGSYMVGDRSSDIQAGHAAGCYAIHIDCGYAEPMLGKADHTVGDLAEAVSHILAREQGKS